MRSALLGLLLLLALAVPAGAQGPTAAAGPTVTATAQDDPGAEDPGDTSDPGDFSDDPLDGADDPATCGDYGDYGYCGCGAGDYAADYTYYYCADAAGGEPPPTVRKHKGVSGTGAGGTVQALPASSLPYTGDRPWVIALIGLSFVMMGAGGRLRLKR